MAFFYPGGSGGKVEVLEYSHSDMAGDSDDIKSTSGVIFFLGDNPAT
jgi:hypothetical protein